MKLIVAFNGLVIQNGGVTGHAQPQVGVVVGVDMEGLLEPMQFKRQELMVGEVL